MNRCGGFLFAAALGLSACGADTGASADPYTRLTLGVVIDRASASAFYSWPDAANLAITQINEGLAQAGSRLRMSLLLNDTSQDSAVATMRSLEVVRNQNAKAIITDTTKNGVAITKLMYDGIADNDLDVPVMCVTCTAPGLSDPQATGTDSIDTATLRDAENWHFRTCNRATEQTSVLKRVITTRGTRGDVNGDGKFKVAILVFDDNSGHGFAKSTQQLFAEVNPDVIVEKIVLVAPNLDINNSQFWDGIAAKLIDGDNDCPQDPANVNGCLPAVQGDGKPDAVMENLNPGSNIAISQALARIASPVTFFHAHAFRAAQTADVLGAAVNGQQGVSPALYDEATSGLEFAATIRGSLAREPAVLDSSMYDAAVTLSLAAIKASHALPDPARVTGAQVRDALMQINAPDGEVIHLGPDAFATAYRKIIAGAPINYEGASGPVDFDANGNVWVKLALYEGVSGGFKDRQLFDCVHDHACPATTP
jgi:hypothetical protein